jgi:four helix bundle protein
MDISTAGGGLVGDFKKLKVWQKSHQLALDMYKATEGFPDRERFGLTGQVRRAATSIPTNIAEGCGCGTDNELGRYVRISLGSAVELEYQLILARDLGMLTVTAYQSLSAAILEIQSMLVGLSRKVRRGPQLRATSTQSNRHIRP